MKNPEDILTKELKSLHPNGKVKLFYKIHRKAILNIIKDIQKDAFNSALDIAAKKTIIKVVDHEEIAANALPAFDGETTILPIYGVDEESILRLKIK